MIFRLEYCNKFGDAVRVDITTPGLPTVVEVEGAGDPFRLKYTPDISDKSFRFLTSSAEINIYETPEFNIDTLKTSSETDIKVDYYINNVKKWTGFVLPDFFSREIGGNAVVSMVATDRLSTLKGVTLSDLPASLSLHDIVVRCLAKTGLDLPLKTMVDFSVGQFGFNDFFRSHILSQRLTDNKGRSISCYDVLSSILVASNSKLVQRNAEWHIINKLQHELGEGRLYSNENTSTAWSEVVHNFSEITKGAIESIIPVAASVGVFHEHGGGRIHPDNYDFSKDLTGWNKINDINAWIDNRQIEGYENIGGVLTPKYGISTEKKYLVIRDEVYGAGKNAYLESDAIDIPYINSDGVDVTFDVSGIAHVGGELRFSVVAKKGSDVIALNETGSFVSMGSGPIYRRLKGFEKSGEVKSMSVSGSLIVENISQWKLSIRIYGVGNISTVIVNEAIITMKNSQTVPKGNLYKREQGNNYTRSHDIETSIFGDYITGGLNGYFYDYPIDDTSSLYSPYGNLREKWIDPTDPNGEELPLLQHVARQKARMFSVAHDKISGEIEMVNFDPLAIFVDCSGKRYSLVSAEVDFLRSTVNFEIEEIAYQNLTVRDFIYSYFGEGESSIKSVGGIASGSGGGTGGGGMTNDQIAILNDVAELAHSHENKEVLDQITQDMVDNASREMVTSTDTETELSDENYLSSLRTIKEITERSISKITEDEAQEVITFLKGIISEGTSHFVNLIASGKITAENIDVNDTLKTQILQAIVRAELQDVILKGQLNSETFTSGFLGEGFRLNKINDRWTLELDDLIIRKTMQVYELIVQRIRYQGGQVLHSPAGGKITAVTNGGSYWRVEHDSPDDFITNDQVQCQNFKVGSAAQNPDGSTTFEGVSVKRYWRLVTSYGRGWFNLSKTDMEAGSAEPEVGDDIVVLGNRTDPTRQNAYMIVSTGANSPYTAHLAGINSYSTAGKEVVREGNLEGIIDSAFGQLSGYGFYGQNVFLRGRFSIQSGSTTVLVPADKGSWSAGTYYYYDRVSHNGSLWLCVAQPSTTSEPTDGSPAWEKQVDKGTDGKGISDTQVRYQVSSSGTVVPTGTWLTSVPSLSAGQFLWTRTITTYTDSTSTTSYSVSKYGETGASGKGISSTVITYQAGTSGTVIPTGTWTSSIPSVAENQFLWTRTVITYTDGTTSTSYSVSKMGAVGESLAEGKMLYKDPTFKSGVNTAKLYNGGSGSVSLTRIAKTDDAPSDSTHILRFTYTSGSPSPGFGGFWFGNLSRANAVFITKIIAKIPEGKTINWSSNAYGTGGTQKWLTSTAGTGKYDTYLCKVICGASGTFSGTNYFYFTGGSGAFDVDIAFATVYDMTVYDDIYDKKIVEYDAKFIVTDQGISANASAITSTQNSVTGLTTRVSAAESQLTIQAGQIASKVSQTEYDSNNVAISGEFSTINQRATNIELSVSDILIDNVNYYSLNKLKADKYSPTGDHWRVRFTLSPNTTYTVQTTIPRPSSGIMDCWAGIEAEGTFVESSTVNGVASDAPRILTTGATGNLIVSFRKTHYDNVLNGTYKITLTKEYLPAKLLATGINIENQLITLTANKTVFKSNSGAIISVFNSTGTKIVADAISLEGLTTINSNFKVLLDGSIEAVNGKFTGQITATSGAVGGFSISASSLESVSGSNSMLLSSNLVRFIGQYSSVYIGADTWPATTGGAILGTHRITVDRTIAGYSYGNFGLYMDIKGSTSYDDSGYQYTGNHAIYCVNGDYAGFRLRTRRISTGHTLSDMDNVILLVNTSSITITLPSVPKEGQIYVITSLSDNSGYTIRVGNTSTQVIERTPSNRNTEYTRSSAWDRIDFYIWDKVNNLWKVGQTASW